MADDTFLTGNVYGKTSLTLRDLVETAGGDLDMPLRLHVPTLPGDGNAKLRPALSWMWELRLLDSDRDAAFYGRSGLELDIMLAD